MSADKVQEALIEALKQTLAATGEQRLFRSGKLDGLFASRSGASAEAASRAIRAGLLEVSRTETKGKTVVEWVRVTPRGVDFLHEHESPRRVLEDLRQVLRTNEQQVPYWLAEMRTEVQTLTQRLTEEAQRWTHRLEALSQRVEEALRRSEAAEARTLQDGAALPWAADALAYLERRTGECPLPELFAALREKHPELSVNTFHDGLRRLQQRESVHLTPFKGEPGDLQEPEYALLDGAALLYYAART